MIESIAGSSIIVTSFLMFLALSEMKSSEYVLGVPRL